MRSLLPLMALFGHPAAASLSEATTNYIHNHVFEFDLTIPANNTAPISLGSTAVRNTDLDVERATGEDPNPGFTLQLDTIEIQLGAAGESLPAAEMEKLVRGLRIAYTKKGVTREFRIGRSLVNPYTDRSSAIAADGSQYEGGAILRLNSETIDLSKEKVELTFGEASPGVDVQVHVRVGGWLQPNQPDDTAIEFLNSDAYKRNVAGKVNAYQLHLASAE